MIITIRCCICGAYINLLAPSGSIKDAGDSIATDTCVCCDCIEQERLSKKGVKDGRL